MEELREPRNYFSLLRAIAQGRTRLNEIAQGASIGDVTTVARYLDILQQMRLITRRVPQPKRNQKRVKREFTILTTISCVSGFAMFIPIKAVLILD